MQDVTNPVSVPSVYCLSVHTSPASHFENFQVFLIYLPNCPGFSTIIPEQLIQARFDMLCADVHKFGMLCADVHKFDMLCADVHKLCADVHQFGMLCADVHKFFNPIIIRVP
jgi:hypothetical protein